jgi:GAF domain-containing protein
MMAMTTDMPADIAAVQRIDAVPRILEVVCRTTGMGFAAVARVTEDRWVACAVRDTIKFGLEPGGELKVETTICDEIRKSREAVAIDHVAEDHTYCGHPTPAMYGFQSYISMPIILSNGALEANRK